MVVRLRLQAGNRPQVHVPDDPARRIHLRGWTDIEVLEFAPPTRLVWAWESADIDTPTRVIFQLEPTAEGTRLKLSHVGDSTADDIASVSGGWPGKLDALVAHLGD
jgi:uncharacterized protein YndB with AHSA1/START domain